MQRICGVTYESWWLPVFSIRGCLTCLLRWSFLIYFGYAATGRINSNDNRLIRPNQQSYAGGPNLLDDRSKRSKQVAGPCEHRRYHSRRGRHLAVLWAPFSISAMKLRAALKKRPKSGSPSTSPIDTNFYRVEDPEAEIAVENITAGAAGSSSAGEVSAAAAELSAGEVLGAAA